MHFQPMPVRPEPGPDFGVFMIGSIVLNQNRPLAAIAPGYLFEEAEIRRAIKDRVPAVVEAGAPEFDGSEDFHVLALACDRNFRRTTHAAPSGVQGGVLPETGFVREN
jgi:hypothetical protein